MPELAFLAPLALLLLPLAACLGLLDGWRARGPRRRFGAALRGLLLCLLVLALALPVLRSASPLPQSLHLVDVSDSIPPAEQARALAAVRAAAATPLALVATITRSQVPTSEPSVVARRRTVRSPDLPSTRSPSRLIASTCSCQVSTAHTSLPASAISAA